MLLLGGSDLFSTCGVTTSFTISTNLESGGDFSRLALREVDGVTEDPMVSGDISGNGDPSSATCEKLGSEGSLSQSLYVHCKTIVQ